MLSAISSALRKQRFFATHRRSYSAYVDRKKTSIHDLQEKYRAGKPITMVTAYDYTSAKLAEAAEIDSVLVGDSYSMVVAGYPNTVSATLEEIIYHAKCVSRGANKTFIVADLPFGSYEVSSEQAVKNAFRLMKEGQVDAIKLEGGLRMKERVKAIVSAGIPVMGHIGLTPQTTSALGGFKVQGNTFESATEIVNDAYHLQEAGCYAIVIESVPQKISEYITTSLHIPTIGIGAGNKTSGQILVWHDMFGLFSDFSPKFNKQFVNAGALITEGLAAYKREVESREFPAPQHRYILKQAAWDQFAQYFNIKKKEASSAEEPTSNQNSVETKES